MVKKAKPVQRRKWLSFIAFVIGGIILIAHVFTKAPMITPPGMFEINPKDLAYHFSFIAVFTLAYRLSYRGSPPGTNRATILVCSGWGAFCEIIQHWIPARDFSVIEFGVNVLTPVIITGIVSFVVGRGK